jgi:putative glycosyltransferase (TIGR04372 family)
VSAAALLEQARVHGAAGRLAEAEAAAQDALVAAPGDPEAMFVLGELAAQQGHVLIGLERLRAALVVRPDHLPARLLLVSLLTELGQHGEAAALLEPVHALVPDHAGILAALADARDRAGDWEGAQECWQKQHAAVEARAAAHPLAGLRLRVLDPGFAIGRIGEMGMQLELFAKMGVLGWRPPMIGVLLAPEGQIVNRPLLDYFRPYVQVVSDPALIGRYAKLRDEGLVYNPVMVKLPSGRVVPDDRGMVAVNRLWQDQGRPPLLSLTARHRERGRRRLVELGAPEDAWFVCLHVRTPGYLREATDSHHRFRNASIETYLPAVERIVGRGGWVVRIGDRSMPPLPPMRGVVDYALSPLRAAWMDVFLLAAARFFLCTTSGPWVIAHNFGTPVAITNQFPFSERPFTDRDLFIPKRYRARRTGRRLSFAEAMQPPFRHQFWAASFDHYGVDVEDNSPAEITALAEEMLDRLVGGAVYDAEDDALQARFNALAGFEAYGISGRIGRDFLRSYRDLLP